MAICHAIVLRIHRFKTVPAVPLTAAVCMGVVFLQWLTLALTEGARFYRSATPSLFAFCLAILGAHFYFHVFNMSESSRRIRLLRQLLKKKSLNETSKAYTPQGMYEIRLNRLVSWRQVTLRNGILYPTASVLSLAAQILLALEKLLFPERFSDPHHEDPEAE